MISSSFHFCVCILEEKKGLETAKSIIHVVMANHVQSKTLFIFIHDILLLLFFFTEKTTTNTTNE